MDHEGFTTLEKMLIAYIILEVRREPTTIIHWHGNKKYTIDLDRGQCFLSMSEMARDLGSTTKKICKTLRYIEKKYGNMKCEGNAKGFIISVLEYNEVVKMEYEGNTKEIRKKNEGNSLYNDKTVKTVKTVKTEERVSETKVSSATKKHTETKSILAVLVNKDSGGIYDKIIEYTISRGIPTSKQAADLLESFAEYWLETDTRGKHRFQKEKTYDIKRRLNTWINNASRFNPKTKEAEYISPF